MDLIDKMINEISSYGEEVALNCEKACGLYTETHQAVVVLDNDGRHWKCRSMRHAEHMIEKLICEGRAKSKYCNDDRYYSRRENFHINPYTEHFHWDSYALRNLHSSELVYLMMALEKTEKKLCKKK